jgi:hypothetical protein
MVRFYFIVKIENKITITATAKKMDIETVNLRLTSCLAKSGSSNPANFFHQKGVQMNKKIRIKIEINLKDGAKGDLSTSKITGIFIPKSPVKNDCSNIYNGIETAITKGIPRINQLLADNLKGERQCRQQKILLFVATCINSVSTSLLQLGHFGIVDSLPLFYIIP